MTVKEIVSAIVSDAIAKAAAAGEIPNEIVLPEPKIGYAKEEKFGDYATPFALETAKLLRKSPMETGEILKKYIEESEIVERVDVVKPGFINMFISFDFLYKNISEVLREGQNYGKREKENPMYYNIEFVSANPTGPLNVVSARAAAIGDTIANLLEASGDTVDREFYVNDYGNQVYLLGRSVLARYRELCGVETDFPEDGYHGEYIRDIASYIKDSFSDEINTLTTEEELIEFFAVRAIEHNVSGQKRDLSGFNVNFKTWFRERSLHEKGEVEDTLKTLEDADVIYEREGKKFFRSVDFGDDKDRVVVRDDGRPTYLLADIAYHRDKLRRKYDRIIDIWGPDHHGYIARLSGAMEAMGCPKENFRVLIAQQVNLLMEGEAVKMSKRLGKLTTMAELLSEIGTDVARYFFIMRSLDSHLDFDLDLATKNSSENPVFYLQYAHARICSIFKEASKREINYDQSVVKKDLLDNPECINLMKMLARFPEEIIDAAEAFEPHRLTVFLMKLAQGFHKFYTEHRVLSDDRIKTVSYLVLIDAVRTVMKSGLGLLGVTAPEAM